MILIKSIFIQQPENVGCNNGNYSDVMLIVQEGKVIHTICGDTCRCQNGCSGTWNMNNIKVGDTFETEEDLYRTLGEL